MSARSFAGFNPKPSPWGYNWSAAPPEASPPPPQNVEPEPQLMAEQLANMPAALLTSLKREKKPFTYTPGGVNLNEVLNARLQKRMERKKRYSEEARQVVVRPTHNSPLDMYSMENALEVLEAQATLVANDKSLSSRSATLPRNHTFRFDDEDRGVTQSKAFKVLQIITDTEQDSSPGLSQQEEMRFTGLRDSKTIPSRFFQTLQKITGTEDADEEEPAAQSHTVPPRFYQSQPSQPTVNNAVPSLKRPAAFLPIKTTPGFRPVQPSFLVNGSVKRTVTDF